MRDEEEALAEQAFRDVASCSWARQYGYSYFVSKSKGRGRKRRHWREVELVGVGPSYVEFIDGRGKLDRYCPAGKTEDELITELRYLDQGRKKWE